MTRLADSTATSTLWLSSIQSQLCEFITMILRLQTTFLTSTKRTLKRSTRMHNCSRRSSAVPSCLCLAMRNGAKSERHVPTPSTRIGWSIWLRCSNKWPIAESLSGNRRLQRVLREIPRSTLQACLPLSSPTIWPWSASGRNLRTICSRLSSWQTNRISPSKRDPSISSTPLIMLWCSLTLWYWRERQTPSLFSPWTCAVYHLTCTGATQSSKRTAKRFASSSSTTSPSESKARSSRTCKMLTCSRCSSRLLKSSQTNSLLMSWWTST